MNKFNLKDIKNKKENQTIRITNQFYSDKSINDYIKFQMQAFFITIDRLKFLFKIADSNLKDSTSMVTYSKLNLFYFKIQINLFKEKFSKCWRESCTKPSSGRKIFTSAWTIKISLSIFERVWYWNQRTRMVSNELVQNKTWYVEIEKNSIFRFT